MLEISTANHTRPSVNNAHCPVYHFCTHLLPFSLFSFFISIPPSLPFLRLLQPTLILYFLSKKMDLRTFLYSFVSRSTNESPKVFVFHLPWFFFLFSFSPSMYLSTLFCSLFACLLIFFYSSPLCI